MPKSGSKPVAAAVSRRVGLRLKSRYKPWLESGTQPKQRYDKMAKDEEERAESI